MDSNAVSVGLTATYKFETSALDVTPHLGLRYTYLDTDSYTVKSNKGAVAHTDSDEMNIFSIPVGVTLSRDFANGDWTIKPVLDLAVTFNTGDTDFDSKTTFVGVDNALSLTSEVIDEVTYGATVGINASYGNLSLGVGVNYTGSENTDEFGAQANVGFKF